MTDPRPVDEALVTLGAQGLAKMWLDGKDVREIMASPEAEPMIIETTVQLTDTGFQNDWISHVRGDGADLRMNALADRCAEEARRLSESLRSK